LHLVEWIEIFDQLLTQEDQLVILNDFIDILDPPIRLLFHKEALGMPILGGVQRELVDNQIDEGRASLEEGLIEHH
jgi:hypothetical protein